MLEVVEGNVLDAQAEALVNTVNTKGVMGKGVALAFKKAFPDNFKAYEKACQHGDVVLGRMFVFNTGLLAPRLIINFPTKNHWRSDARIEDIEAGLADLVEVIRREGVGSLAMPPIGCGFGGLRWEDVLPRIKDAFNTVPNVNVFVYAPTSVARPRSTIVRTPKPAMTAWRAALIKVVEAYARLGYEATHLEAQKLLYFLHRAGEPIKVSFIKGKYGPYDDTIRHALIAMDGHYLVGFGDGGRLEPVILKEGAISEADKFIEESNDSSGIVRRIDRVIRLIEGFESPYGLELLATLHWVHEQEGASNVDEGIRLAHEWNERKARVLNSRHLRVAWEALQAQGWLRPSEPSTTPLPIGAC